MAQRKAHEVERWIARPDPSARIVLVYGPDRGSVSERVRLLAKSTGLSADDPFSVVRLEATDIERDPGQLIDEARMVPMFGGERLIWINNAGSQKALADAVKLLCAEPPRDALVLIEAGDLKKGAALRTAVENAASAMALPCYADDPRQIDQLINDELAKDGLTISLEARELLKSGLGGDRLATRGEIAKLALYCLGKRQVSVEDVVESLGDAAGVSADDVVMAVLKGAPADFEAAFSRLTGSGTSPFLVLSATMRQYSQLLAWRDLVERGGKPASSIIASARPPVHFSKKDVLEGALSVWTVDSIAKALERLQETVLETRRQSALESELTRHILLALLVESSRRRRN